MSSRPNVLLPLTDRERYDVTAPRGPDVEPPEDTDGRSLRPLFEGNVPDD